MVNMNFLVEIWAAHLIGHQDRGKSKFCLEDLGPQLCLVECEIQVSGVHKLCS